MTEVIDLQVDVTILLRFHPNNVGHKGQDTDVLIFLDREVKEDGSLSEYVLYCHSDDSLRASMCIHCHSELDEV